MRRALPALLALALLSGVVGALLWVGDDADRGLGPVREARPSGSEHPGGRRSPSPPEPPPAETPAPRVVTEEQVRADPASTFVADEAERKARAALFEVSWRVLVAVDPEVEPETIASMCDASGTRCRSRTPLRVSTTEEEVRRALDPVLAAPPNGVGGSLTGVTVTARPAGGSVVEIELTLD